MPLNYTEGDFLDFLKSKKYHLWDLGNKVLYNLCKEHPLHVKPDVVAAKIWLIGRAYAASIERRKNKKNETNDQFYEKVVNAIIKFNNQEELDKKIKELNSTQLNEDMIKQILIAHKKLLEVLKKLTELNKRSFVSKYLHFHCDKVPLYDSQANGAINALSKEHKTEVNKIKNNLNKDRGKNDYDEDYLNFCSRYLFWYRKFNSEIKFEKISARHIDDYLLYLANN